MRPHPDDFILKLIIIFEEKKHQEGLEAMCVFWGKFKIPQFPSKIIRPLVSYSPYFMLISLPFILPKKPAKFICSRRSE